ncbi:putative phosphoribosyl transferasec [mine drainage metagenome]|uniref:Putative phosphoribosyl transferasec n=1 Tax=mine drainage metagenome TaxID=410659 RepID=A0A1J5RB32_9ZZZZ
MDDRFQDRFAAGRKLAQALQAYAGRHDVLVLAVPRGGVPVGYEVAKALGAELDVLIARKLGLPRHPELAMGAIASGDALYLNPDVIAMSGVSRQEIEAVLADERIELQRRETQYRGARPPVRIDGRVVIVVDDGIATGASMRAAVMALRSQHPDRIVVAVPVAPPDAKQRLGDIADDFVCVLSPEPFYAVGQFYDTFDQTSDEEVRRLLARSREETP